MAKRTRKAIDTTPRVSIREWNSGPEAMWLIHTVAHTGRRMHANEAEARGVCVRATTTRDYHGQTPRLLVGSGMVYEEYTIPAGTACVVNTVFANGDLSVSTAPYYTNGWRAPRDMFDVDMATVPAEAAHLFAPQA